MLEIAILGNANDEDIEYIILDNVFINRDEFQREPDDLFHLDNYTDEEIKLNFRFEREDIPRIVEALGVPAEVITETGNKVSGKNLSFQIFP